MVLLREALPPVLGDLRCFLDSHRCTWISTGCTKLLHLHIETKALLMKHYLDMRGKQSVYVTTTFNAGKYRITKTNSTKPCTSSSHLQSVQQHQQRHINALYNSAMQHLVHNTKLQATPPDIDQCEKSLCRDIVQHSADMWPRLYHRW